MENKISAAEYARLHNKSESSVKGHIKRGNIKAEKINGKWCIDKDTPYPPRIRYKDLTGLKFGLLTVREYAGKKGNGSLWLCDCECGNIKIASSNSLSVGYTKSCGCLGNGSTETEVRGKKYGRLTPIRSTGRRDSKGSTIWECSCSCGNPVHAFVSVRNLLGGEVTSCGCKKVAAGKIMQPKATEGAKKSPKSGRFETNVNAKHWILIAPDGVKYECDNLTNWARNHADLFGMDPGDDSARRIFHGFSNIAQSLLGTRKDAVHTYKGWGLAEEPSPNKSELPKKSTNKNR